LEFRRVLFRSTCVSSLPLTTVSQPLVYECRVRLTAVAVTSRSELVEGRLSRLEYSKDVASVRVWVSIINQVLFDEKYHAVCHCRYVSGRFQLPFICRRYGENEG